jgi:hypothetical protein
LLVIIPLGALAADVTLAWDANTESDLEGYGVYFRRGSSGPPYDLFGYVSVDELSNADSPAFTVTGLQSGATYCFAVTAYDASGNESAYSAPACAQLGDAATPSGSSGSTAPPSSSSAAGSGTSSGGGGGGGGCFIQTVSGG